MTAHALTEQLNPQLNDLLTMHHVTVSQPREQMLQLDDVPVGAAFNRPMTNVLLRDCSSGNNWQVFVDEDLQYVGEDANKRQVFAGTRHRGWLHVTTNMAVRGDVNDTIVWVLNQLESELRTVAPQELRRRFETAEHAAKGNPSVVPPADPLERLDRRVARLIDLNELENMRVEPTFAQADAICLAAETVLRPAAPNCSLLMGPSGVGKSLVARLAARELVRRGRVRQIVEIRAAAICAGPIFLPERDERLRGTLDLLSQAGDVLVIFEQFDLVLSKSLIAASILADCLDSRIKMIGVARAEFQPDILRRSAQLRRRVEPCMLTPPDYREMAEILRRRWAEHSLASELQLSADVLPLVNEYSGQRLGANPAAAIGLLEAVLNRAAFSGQQCVGPDDVFHLVGPRDNS